MYDRRGRMDYLSGLYTRIYDVSPRTGFARKPLWVSTSLSYEGPSSTSPPSSSLLRAIFSLWSPKRWDVPRDQFILLLPKYSLVLRMVWMTSAHCDVWSVPTFLVFRMWIVHSRNEEEEEETSKWSFKALTTDVMQRRWHEKTVGESVLVDYFPLDQCMVPNPHLNPCLFASLSPPVRYT